MLLSVLIVIAVLTFFALPFLLSGMRGSWRGPSVILGIFGTYAIAAWLTPLPAGIHESDALGANAWRLILIVLLVACSMALATGLSIAALRARGRK